MIPRPSVCTTKKYFKDTDEEEEEEILRCVFVEQLAGGEHQPSRKAAGIPA